MKVTEKSSRRKLNDAEVNTILCALRGMYAEGEPQMCSPRTCDHFEEVEPLTKREMERLASQMGLDGVILEYFDDGTDAENDDDDNNNGEVRS